MYLEKILQHLTFLIAIISSHSTINKSNRIILHSLCTELTATNIITIKNSSFIVDFNVIDHVKFFSSFNIYSSLLSIQDMNITMNKRKSTSKTIVLLNELDLNFSVKHLISENENNAFRYSWLVWNNNGTVMEQIGKLYIPYNTQFLVLKDSEVEWKVSEIYHSRIFEQDLFEIDFGKWTENEGLKIFGRDFYKRRLDMNGTILTALTDSENFEPEWQDIISSISEKMNFRLFLTDRNYYEEQVKPVQKVSWEISLIPVLLQYLSFKKNNFAFGPFWKFTAFVYIRYDSIYEQHDIFIYLRPFSEDLWRALLFYTFFIGTCTLLVAKFGDRKIGYANAFYQPFDATSNQYGGNRSTMITLRLIILLSRFMALFVVPAYSASLLNSILLPKIRLPFKNLKGLVNDKSYKVGFSKNSNLKRYFLNSRNNYHQMIYDWYLLDKLPETVSEAYRKFCELKKVAFIFFEDPAFNTNCRTIKIPNPFFTDWRGLYLRANSPYKRIFNRIFKIFISSGILNKYDSRVLKSDLPSGKNFLNEGSGVRIEIIAPVLKVTAWLYCLALFMFILEIIWKKITDFSKRKNY